MPPRLRLRPLDYVAIVAAIAAIAGTSVSVYSLRGGEANVIITGASGEWIYPLDQNRRIEVPGPLGSTWVEIHDKAVHITESPCPNKTCVAAGDIASPGQWTACLPNHVFVRIEGGSSKADGVDASAF